MYIKTLSIGTTETMITKIDPTRTSIVIYNNSANILYIGARNQGTGGFPLPASGIISFKIPEDDPTVEIYGIASGAASDIRVYEGYGK